MADKLLGVTAESGDTVYCTVRRLSDNYLLNDADGSFAAAPSDYAVLLAEDLTEKGLFTRSEARQIWPNGSYRITFYRQAYVWPSPPADAPPLAAYEMQVRNDAEVTDGALSDSVAAVATLSTTINSTLNTVNTNVGTILTLLGGSTPEQVIDISEILKRVREIQDKLRLLVLSMEKQSKLKV